jgi:hypothetical protein
VSKRLRLEIRISEHEKEIIEQIKQNTGKNISELMREFLNSFDVENSKKELEKLREERGLILHQLNSIYSELRSHYLPYRLVFDLLKSNSKYFEQFDKNSQRYQDYLEFQEIVASKERLKKLDEIRVKRDSLKSKLNSLDKKINKLNF